MLGQLYASIRIVELVGNNQNTDHGVEEFGLNLQSALQLFARHPAPQRIVLVVSAHHIQRAFFERIPMCGGDYKTILAPAAVPGGVWRRR